MTERSYREINLREWPRASHYYYFRNFEDPFFNLTANLDVTRLVSFCRDESRSFFLTYMYYATLCANEIAEFRLRILDKRLVEFSRVNSGSTILNPDHTFSFCYFDFDPDLDQFSRDGKEAIEHLRRQPNLEPRNDLIDLIHCSTIPWVSFSGFKHARKGDQTDSVPKLVFGKVFEQDGKLWMPVNVEVHHALMDGLHVGRYFELFQQKIRMV